MSALKPHIGRGADVLTDGAPAYVKPLAGLGANLTQTDADDHAINRVNTLHARLEDFMFGFHGVSTKYLQAYLDWFQWLGAFADGCGDTGDDRLLARQLGNGLYRIRRRTTSARSRHTWTTGKKPHDIVHTMYSQNIET